MENQVNNFKQEYDQFIARFQSDIVGTEEIGKQIGRQIQFYGDAVRVFVNVKIAFDKRLSEYEQRTDENTGKTYSSTKAEKIVNSLPEGVAMLRAEWDLKVIMEQVGALRNMQWGVQKEQGMMGGI